MIQKTAVPHGLRWITRAASGKPAAIPAHVRGFQRPAAIPAHVRGFQRPATSGSGIIAAARPVPRQGLLFNSARVYVTFIDRDKVEHKIACNVGDNLLDIAQAHDLDVEGACGGSCACSTCHIIVADEEMYNKLPPETEDEGDMLDLAFGLTDTSRLGCQVIMTKDIDGIVVKLPSATRNLQARDFEKPS